MVVLEVTARSARVIDRGNAIAAAPHDEGLFQRKRSLAVAAVEKMRPDLSKYF